MSSERRRVRPDTTSTSASHSSPDYGTTDPMAGRAEGASRGGVLGKNAEIQENTLQLAKANDKLERMLAKLGTKADTVEFRTRLEKDLKATNKLAKSLMTLINSNKTGERSVVAKLASEFSREFKRFEALHEQISAKDQAIMAAMNKREGKSRPGTPPKSRGRGGDDDDEDRPLKGGRGRAESSGESAAQAQLEAEMQIEFVEYDVAEIEDRHQRILEIERDVQEVSSMFKDLQTLVEEQDEKITTIGDNITRTLEQTQGAHTQLVATEKLQGQARKKKCCLLFIVLGILTAVVVMSLLLK